MARDWPARGGKIIDGALCHAQNSGRLCDAQHIASKNKPALGGPPSITCGVQQSLDSVIDHDQQCSSATMPGVSVVRGFRITGAGAAR
ncbi:hypothetical protein vBBaMIFTN8_37 [Bordetella phage vB_BaM-IFTN8]|nr:hypothetical protein vBBaMIFTN8_37 [Bordetella phage vB_BaM-IFTN8]